MSTLLSESKIAREDFILALSKVEWNNELRTTAETLITLYDQYIYVLKKHPELEELF